MVENTKRNGGVPARIGKKFSEEVEYIKRKRVEKGFDKADSPLSTEKITNLMTKHKFWKEFVNNIINAKEEEIEKYGL